MPFIPVNNCAAIELRMTQDGQKIENTLYAQFDVNPGAADLETLANIIIEWWQSDIAELVSEAVNLVSVYVRDLTNQGSQAVDILPSSTTSGTITASPPLPNSVTAAISFRTGLAGRSYRGRNYIVGLVDSHVTDNSLVSSIRTAYIAAYTNLRSILLDANLTWVVVSRYHLGDPRTSGVTTPITSVGFADATVDSQRRRLPGRGQ